MSDVVLRVEGLSKSFGELSVLKNVDLAVERGQRIALIGPSGTGKSVFLRSVAMLEKPDSGHVYVGETDITQRGVNLNLVRQKMGMVYQGFHLFSHMNVLDNITFAPIKVCKQSRREAEQKAEELLTMVGMHSKIRAMPDTLSGGQKQRVAIARCLAMEPDILLLDEPTSALDPAMTAEVLAIIRKLAQTGLTLLLVTHEMSFAREFAERVLYMDELGIYEDGTPEQIFDTPKRPKTIAFIDRLKIFEEKITTAGFDIVGMNARVEVYFERYGLARKRLNSLQLLLEELLVLLLRELYTQTEPDIKIAVQYADNKKTVELEITYGSECYNPLKIDGDDLGVMLIRGLCAEIAHEYVDGFNIVNLTLK